MPDDRDEGTGAAKLMKRAQQLSSSTPDEVMRRLMPSDVLRGDHDMNVPPRDPNNAPDPRPRTPFPEAPANVPDNDDQTQVRLPPNPVTGRPAGGGLDIVPVKGATAPVTSPSEEATQVRIEPEPPRSGPEPEAKAKDTSAAAEKKPSSNVKGSGQPKLATAEDLGMGGADLQKEPLLKWIAIGLGLMMFVSMAFILTALLVFAMTAA